MTDYNENNCPHDFYWNVWVTLIYDFGVAFYCAAFVGLQKSEEYSTTYSILECSMEPQAAEVLSSRKVHSNSNPLCVAFCFNLNFVNITGSTLAHSYWALQDQKQMKMLSKLSPFFYYYFLLCLQYCADAKFQMNTKVKEISELRSLYYVFVYAVFAHIWMGNICFKYFWFSVNYRNIMYTLKKGRK